jgi:starvation-inducible outer membrane lipoprotein
MRTALLTTLAAAALAACSTTPEPIEETVIVEVDPFETCTPISALTRVTIPEKTQTRIEIVEIENPPYEPIQDRQTVTRVIEPARTIFQNSEGVEVTDICDTQINPSGMTSEGSR